MSLVRQNPIRSPTLKSAHPKKQMEVLIDHCSLEYRHQILSQQEKQLRTRNTIRIGFSVVAWSIILVKPFNSFCEWGWRSLNLFTFDQSSLETNLKIDANDKDFNAPLKLGEKVLQWEVTSAFGKRESPTVGASSDHKGADIGTSVGTPLYAIGKTDGKNDFSQGYVDVACPLNIGNPPEGLAAYVTSPLLPEYEFALFHLNECYSGRHPIGAMIAKTGNTGISTAPHLHFGVKKNGQWIDPPRGFVISTLQGKWYESTTNTVTVTDDLKPLLDTIRYAEGTHGEDGYKTMFSGAKFNDFSKHPDTVYTTIFNGKELKSAAAGAYQFMPDTWSRVSKAINAIDFSPPNQDRGAIFLIKERGVYNLAKQGEIKKTIFGLCKEWASLPCYDGDTKGAYNQAVKPINELMEVYKSKSNKTK